MNLTIGTARDYVRSRIDELPIDSVMLSQSVDDANMNSMIDKNIEEAIRYIHLTAPAVLMEGLELTQADTSSDGSGSTVKANRTDSVLDIDFSTGTIDVLRVVSFKAGDSSILLTETFAEDSAKAHMQSNSYAKGIPEDPALIMMADSKDYRPHLRYYTTEGNSFSLIYFPNPSLTSATNPLDSYYYISAKLQDAVLEYLTSMVLTAYKEVEFANVFITRAQAYLR